MSGDGARESLSSDYVLTTALQAAVPGIFELRGHSDQARQRLGDEGCEHIASHGDDILFKSRRKGDTAAAFNRLIPAWPCSPTSPAASRSPACTGAPTTTSAKQPHRLQHERRYPDDTRRRTRCSQAARSPRQKSGTRTRDSA